MIDLTDREKEIAVFREEKKLTFRAIGELYHISTSRASQIYRMVLRKRREEERRRLYEEENKMHVNLDITVEEIDVLVRLLRVIPQERPKPGARYIEYGLHWLEDSDFSAAVSFRSRLRALERSSRSST